MEKQLQAAQAGGKVTKPEPEPAPKKGNECKFMQKVIKSTVVLFLLFCLSSPLVLPLVLCLVIACLGLRFYDSDAGHKRRI